MKLHYTTLRFVLFNVILFSYSTLLAQKQGQEKIDSLLFVLINYHSTCDYTCLADSLKINTLNRLGFELSSQNPDTSLILHREALSLSQKIIWPLGTGNSYYSLARVNYFVGGYSESRKYFEMAIEEYKTLKIESGYDKIFINNKIAESLKNLGSVYLQSGKYPEALNYYLQALKIAEETGNPIIVAGSIENIGLVYKKVKNYVKAKEYYSKSLSLNESAKNEIGIADTYLRLGTLYSELDRNDSAKYYQLKALEIYERLNNKIGLIKVTANIGAIYNDEKDFHSALPYYFKGLKMAEEINDLENKAILLGNIGLAYFSLNNLVSAEKFLLHASNLADSLGDLDEIVFTNETLSDLYSKTGKFKMALSHYKIAATAQGSIFNDSAARNLIISELTYNMKNEQEKKDAISKSEQNKKDAEIDRQKLLRNGIAGGAGVIILSGLFSFIFYKRKRDAENQKKEMALNLQVSETEMKALRSQMNPHFVFNALQSIQTFLLSHKSEEANIYLLKFSKLMRAVLENSQHREISLEKDLQALELYMQLESIRLQHPFTYKFHVDESVDLEEMTVPPLILQPFVENAIWHGLQYKDKAGHIDIYLIKKDNALFATVEDNGVGRDMSKKVEYPMLSKKESLGMKLTEERLKILNELKKIKAQFKITDLYTKDDKPSGTKVELSLPY